MNYTKAESLQSVEQTMRTLKLSGMAKEWRSVAYRDSEQYMRELLDIEVREREANRMVRMVKQAGFRVMKSLDDFVWKPTIELPAMTFTKPHSVGASKVQRMIVRQCSNGAPKMQQSIPMRGPLKCSNRSPPMSQHLP